MKLKWNKLIGFFFVPHFRFEAIWLALWSQGGITPKFKWQGWSNGEKYQNPKKFLKPPTNINPTQKNPMPNFRALKICRMYWILKEPQNTEQLKQVWFYTVFSELRGWHTLTYHESSDWFESAQTKSLLESSQPKNTAKFSYPKHPVIKPKKPSLISLWFALKKV